MISIVTSYYNRKQLFYETLKSITKSKVKDIELIVVDDGSSPEHRIEDFLTEFPFIKIVRLEKENKWYSNPCVAFNIGIRKAKGDIIVLQNPECLHVHDVLTYITENLNDSNYLTISAYGVNNEINKLIPTHLENNTLIDFFKTLPQQPYVGYESIGWYNHSIYRPVGYHFCSAITRTNMEKLNGFDERYATGIGYDDDELLIRIMYKMGLRRIIEDKISVIHQYHDTVSWNKPNADSLTEKNRSLLHNVTMKEPKYNVNFIKLWG
jgi:glycosyltransferase involved in cell wall biosynthesis